MVMSIEARSPLFAVATARGGRMTWIFEPSDARIFTLPLLRSTSVTSPATTWCTPADAGAVTATGAPVDGDITTTGVPVDDGSVVVVVPGVLGFAHPAVSNRSPVPQTIRAFIRAPPSDD